ncbi:MAG: hypothetical protein HKN10_08260 [Myxococcales bacterium]|nr:hypothetical protein [Myxococcales bacterium]
MQSKFSLITFVCLVAMGSSASAQFIPKASFVWDVSTALTLKLSSELFDNLTPGTNYHPQADATVPEQPLILPPPLLSLANVKFAQLDEYSQNKQPLQKPRSSLIGGSAPLTSSGSAERRVHLGTSLEEQEAQMRTPKALATPPEPNVGRRNRSSALEPAPAITFDLGKKPPPPPAER